MSILNTELQASLSEAFAEAVKNLLILLSASSPDVGDTGQKAIQFSESAWSAPLIAGSDLSMKTAVESLFAAHINLLMDYLETNAISTVTVSDEYTVQEEDGLILVDVKSGDVKIHLPRPESASTRPFIVKKIDSSANIVYIYAVGLSEIDGNVATQIGTQYQSKTFVSDGTNYHIVADSL